MKMHHRLLAGLAIAVFGITLVDGAAMAANSHARVTRWIDGDTVETSRGTVRLIGYDTPERGKCGYAKATKRARQIAPVGSRITLGNPRRVDNRDRYDRVLRYVSNGGRDVGVTLIRDGAKARYDSTDGYDHHPKQRRYHRADAAHRNYHCTAKPPNPQGGSGALRSYLPASTWNCPSYAPIKGNASSMIYHRPGQAYYDATTPEECFKTARGAQRHGYRAAMI